MAKQAANKRLDMNQLSKRIADIATGNTASDKEKKPVEKKDKKKGDQ